MARLVIASFLLFVISLGSISLLNADRSAPTLASAPARLQTTTQMWILPTGDHLSGGAWFVDQRWSSLEWHVTRSERLIVYHVNPLHEPLSTWEGLLAKAEAWTGLETKEPLVVWVFPALDSFQGWADSDIAGGKWLPNAKRILVYYEPREGERLAILFHEMVHALGLDVGPAWYFEGLAQLYEARFGASPIKMHSMRWNAKQLGQEARKSRIDPTVSQHGKGEPFDPYTIGSSIWLFVKHHHGEEGVRRYVQKGRSLGAEAALEEMFGKPIDDIWSDWNHYLQGDEFLNDWSQP
jgi:hypothetical protein